MSTLLIYTGGTIGMVKNNTGNFVPFSVDGLIQFLPELKENIENQSIECLSMEFIKDSSNFAPFDWITLRNLILENHSKHENVLVLHGTDTMAYSSSAISFLMHDFEKNIVFTGAQVPMFENNSDGKDNLFGALAILQQLQSMKIKGQTLLKFGTNTYVGNRVSKSSTESLDAFTGDEFLVEKQVNNESLVSPSFNTISEIETNVVLIKMYPGIQLNMIMDGLLNNPPKGILVESFGTGNIAGNDTFIDGLQHLINAGTEVLNISQCSRGKVNMTLYDTGAQLEKIGVINGKNMTTEAAITKLMLLLSLPVENRHDLLSNSIAGEITK